MRKQILAIGLFFSVIFFLRGQEIPIPELQKRVTDLTGTLQATEQQSLERKLEAFEKEKGSQVTVLIIPTTGDETIEQFGIRLADEWEIGRGGVDDGVILIVALNDRRMRIEVGYGLEGALTDAYSKRIISNIITPEFRSGHFYDGINEGVDAIIAIIRGEELPEVTQVSQSGRGGSGGGRFILYYIFFILGMNIFSAVVKKKLGGTKTFLISFVILFITGWIFFNLAIALIASLIGSLILIAPSGRGGGGMRGGYYGGFGGGGGFSGGGFGGGFSGGGGGFGGGGASGSW